MSIQWLPEYSSRQPQMAVGPIPSDPRTWDDFSDPEARGFSKIDRDTPLEAFTFATGFILAVFGAFWGWAVYSPPNPALQGGAVALLNDWPPVALFAAGLALLAVRLLTDNFYLVDTARHAIYYHFELAWYRRVRLLIERRDIFGTSTESRWRASRYGGRRPWNSFTWKYSWFEHRVVVIDMHGNVFPLSNWQQEALWDCNNDASDLAKKLDCAWFELPEDSRLIVTRRDKGVNVSFGPVTWLTQPGLGSKVWLGAMILVIVVATIAIFWK